MKTQGITIALPNSENVIQLIYGGKGLKFETFAGETPIDTEKAQASLSKMTMYKDDIWRITATNEKGEKAFEIIMKNQK